MLKLKFFLISLIFCIALPIYAQMIFQDNFDNPGVSEDNWEIISGNWEFKDNMLYSPNSDNQFVTIYVSESKWDKDTPDKYDEYIIEFRFMRESGPECCRPIWRAIAEPLPKGPGDRAGFYEWNIAGWTNTRSVLRRFDLDGTANFLLDSQNNDQSMELAATVEDGIWYEVKVVVRNDGMTEGYFDGQKSWEIEDNTWTDGRIGLANWLANVSLDDYKVYGPETTFVEPIGNLVTVWGNLKVE